jgi:two-component system sensor
MSKRFSSRQLIEIVLHVVVWGYIFTAPLFTQPQDNINVERLAMRTLFSLALFLTFYLNYFWFIPAYFWRRRFRLFVLSNLVALVMLSSGIETVLHFHLLDYIGLHSPLAHPHPRGEEGGFLTGITVVLFIRNVLTFAFAWGAAMAVRLSVRWHDNERARNEAELGRTEAELLNLKSQISPHFLLNTLNNIYALTAFDTTSAQKAILELSKMLRYQLYKELGSRVSLQKEAEFLHNYIALMQLRISGQVEVVADFNPDDFQGLSIAPHIFISLVENAFKHGISPTKESYIHISLNNDNGLITFLCRNSNFPQKRDDKKSGGIGLQQVERRLQLSYPNAYTWEYGTTPDELEYFSHIEFRAESPHSLNAKSSLL